MLIFAYCKDVYSYTYIYIYTHYQLYMFYHVILSCPVVEGSIIIH